MAKREEESLMARLVSSIEDLSAQVAQKKRLVNELCHELGEPPRYDNVDSQSSDPLSGIKRDQFYGRPLATAIREYLAIRGSSDKGGRGAATVNEIFDALKKGGYKFDTKNDLNAKRGLRDALQKNTVTFHKVGDSRTNGDAYGLIEWYPKPQLKTATDK